MSKKKMTAGERIVERFKIQYDGMLPGQVVNGHYWAKQIDAAIRREVKKVLLAKPSDRPNPYEMARPRSHKP
jgi:hypothetical protein